MIWTLVGCYDEPSIERIHVVEDEVAPVAPWDPIAVEAMACDRRLCDGAAPSCEEDEVCSPPRLTEVDADVQPLVHQNTGQVYAFIPVDEWPAGSLEVDATLDGDVVWTVRTDIQSGVTPMPGTWRIQYGWSPHGMDSLLDTYIQAWLVLDEVREDSASFRLITQVETNDRGPCTFIQADADLVDGVLSWDRRELTPSVEPPIDAYDLWFRVLFTEAGGGVGGEAHVLADLREFDAQLEEDPELNGACELLLGFGSPCTAPCPDGEEGCLDVMLHGISLQPEEAGDWDELPRCGLDATDPDQNVWSCSGDWDFDLDFDICSSTGVLAVGWPALALALGVLRRRRS